MLNESVGHEEVCVLVSLVELIFVMFSTYFAPQTDVYEYELHCSTTE